MKKISLLSLLLLSIITIGCSKTSAPSQPQDETESTAPSDDSQINQDAIGGHMNGYADLPYNLDFYGISTSLVPLVDKDELDNWLASCESSPGHPTEDCNILNFIQTFNIPKDDLTAISESHEIYNMFTAEQIDALYSNSKKQLADTFMNSYAVRVGDEIYPPKWVATHTLDELKAAGITESLLEAKCSEWKETFGESSDVYTGAKALLDQYQAEIESTE